MPIPVSTLVRVKRAFTSDPTSYRWDHGYILSYPAPDRAEIHFVDGKTAIVPTRSITR